MSSSHKLSLPDFLKQLTSNNIPYSKAMQIASKIYKTHNTPVSLAGLTDASLKSLGIQEKDLRRSTLAAFKKAGWKSVPSTDIVGSTNIPVTSAHPKIGDLKSVGSSVLPSASRSRGPKSNKRRRSTEDELPDRPPEEMESAKYGNFDFREVLDEGRLKVKSTVVNRAPIMTAWAAIVAERLGFEREEALSIANVYTEMNAVSKGVSIGVYNPDKGKESQKPITEAQPYVDLMGRRIPLYRLQLSDDRSQWRALSSGEAVPPLTAFKYVTVSMRQTAPYILGAMKLLAQSFNPEELNQKGFSLYCNFRPDIEPGKSGWGKRGKVLCEVILGLRKTKTKEEGIHDDVKPSPITQPTSEGEVDPDGREPRPKKPRIDDKGELDEDELFGD